jgi:hypothetical protein
VRPGTWIARPCGQAKNGRSKSTQGAFGPARDPAVRHHARAGAWSLSRY